jgi:hypothetical protein
MGDTAIRILQDNLKGVNIDEKRSNTLASSLQFMSLDDEEYIEKYSHQNMMLKEAERLEKLNRLSYSRILCCFCFPCLPMWTRTICCFFFLGLCGIIGLVVFFIMSFKKPQIVFNGSGQYLHPSNNAAANTPDEIQFQYSVYNGNFFELNFDSIKAVVYR